jgi:hypothetical protein
MLAAGMYVAAVSSTSGAAAWAEGVYCALQTLTTVGYGAALTAAERHPTAFQLTAILCMILGPALFVLLMTALWELLFAPPKAGPAPEAAAPPGA